MSLRKVLTTMISLLLLLFILHAFSLFLMYYVDYDVLHIFAFLENKKANIIPFVFISSMFVSYVFQKLTLQLDEKKIRKFVNIDSIASQTYRDIFNFVINKDYDALDEICDSDMINSLRIIMSENTNKNLPIRVITEVMDYDENKGIIKVVCTGFFCDNSTSRHVLTFLRDADESYLLHKIGGC